MRFSKEAGWVPGEPGRASGVSEGEHDVTPSGDMPSSQSLEVVPNAPVC